MSDLLPCPFCGDSAAIERYGDRRKSTIYSCDGCGCRLETGEEWGHGSGWNTRAKEEEQFNEITRLREENARLREALKPFAKNEYVCLGRNDLDYYYVLISHIRAAAAAIREGGKDNSADRWRHVKTGGVYEIVGECIIEATNKPAVLYRSVIPAPGKSVWARPKDEFFDGRFEKVETQAGGME